MLVNAVLVYFDGLPAKFNWRLAVEYRETAPGLPAPCPDFEKS
jgi:hypothetical protein